MTNFDNSDIFTFFYNFNIFIILTIFDNWRQLTTILTIQKIAFAILTIEKTILEPCDICNTDYNSDNWEPAFMTIFVIWQLIVTLDSIRNSCDVYMKVFAIQKSFSSKIIMLAILLRKFIMIAILKIHNDCYFAENS